MAHILDGKLEIDDSGNIVLKGKLILDTDGAYDIGESADKRPNNVHAKTGMTINGSAVDVAGTPRPPNGSAGGALIGSYPNPDLKHDIASATALYICENTSWEDITGMSITPPAGTYLVWFNTHVGRTGTDDYAFTGLFIDTTLDTDSLRSTDLALGSYHSWGTQGVLTVNGSQAIKARARVSNAGTDFEIYDRSLIILRVTD